MVDNKFTAYYLGMRARDKLTGVKGIIEAGDEWLNGCVRYALRQEKPTRDGQQHDLVWVDAIYIEILDAVTPYTKEFKKTGGPRQSDTMKEVNPKLCR